MQLYLKASILFVGFALLLWVLASGLRLYISVQKAGQIISRTKPFTSSGSGPSILVIGDSIAFGTGASVPEKSLAGLVAANFEDPSVENWAKNGKRAYQLDDEIKNVTGHYDLILIVVGGNDIIRPQINLKRSADSLEKIYKHASQHADHVVAFTTGNFRYTTLFLPPANYYFETRSSYLRDRAKDISSKISNVTYVDMVSYNEQVEFSKDMEAADNLHLSDKGIAYWHEAAAKATNNFKF